MFYLNKPSSIAHCMVGATCTMPGHNDILPQVTLPDFIIRGKLSSTIYNTDILQDPSFLGRHEVWFVIKELLDQERRTRNYQEQLESRIREAQGACYELHAYCMQTEKRAAEIERNLVLERSKVKELELRVSTLHSVNGALLHHVVTKEVQAQDPRNQPVSIQKFLLKQTAVWLTCYLRPAPVLLVKFAGRSLTSKKPCKRWILTTGATASSRKTCKVNRTHFHCVSPQLSAAVTNALCCQPSKMKPIRISCDLY